MSRARVCVCVWGGGYLAVAAHAKVIDARHVVALHQVIIRHAPLSVTALRAQAGVQRVTHVSV
jgi:hypothetical protein